MSVAEVTAKGREVLGLNHVLPGVAEMIDELTIEASFDDGTKLVGLTPLALSPRTSPQCFCMSQTGFQFQD